MDALQPTNFKKKEYFVKKQKKFIICFTVAIIAGFCFIQPYAFSDDKKKDEILVRIGESIIKRSDLENRIATLPEEYQPRFKNEQQKKELLELVVQLNILSMEAKAVKLDEDRLMAIRLDDAVKSILAQEYVKSIISRVEAVNEADIKKYYVEKQNEFKTPPMVNAQHILIKVEHDAKPEEIKTALSKAKKIRASLLKGANFAKEAEKHSDDPGSKNNGGELGFFTREQMVPEFANAAFSLKKNEIGEPVKSPFGYHIIKVIDKKEEKQMDLAEATPTIQSILENSRRKEAIEKELERLMKKYNVVYGAPEQQEIKK